MSYITVFPPPRKMYFQESEVHTRDSFGTWLLTSLKARGGVFYFGSSLVAEEIPCGSIVLFRYESDIVGEALVKYHNHEERLAQGIEYTDRIVFEPTSIRLFAPSISGSDFLTAVGDETVVEPGYPEDEIDAVSMYDFRKLEDWRIYPNLLEGHLYNVCDNEYQGRFLY